MPHCWGRASSQNERALPVVPTRAQIALETLPTLLKCFAGPYWFPYNVFIQRSFQILSTQDSRPNIVIVLHLHWPGIETGTSSCVVRFSHYNLVAKLKEE